MAILGILVMASIVFAVAAEPGLSLVSRMPEYSEEMKDFNLKRIALANNELGVDLYKYVADTSEENIILSPFSVSTLFNMLYLGSRDNTATELRWLLGFGSQLATLSMDDRDIFATYRIFLTEVLQKLDPTSYAVNCASTVLVDKSFPLLPSYKANLQKYLNAYVQGVNFAGNSRDIVRDLNSWASKNTGGLINHLVDTVYPGTLLLAASAAYFKGMWEVPFDPKRTKDLPFYNWGLRSEAKNVPMMNVKSRLNFYADDDEIFTAVEVPYKGRHVSMLILLPEFDEGLPDVEYELNADKIRLIRRNSFRMPVNITMPRFSIEFTRDLKPYVQDLGVDIFHKPRADFSGMTTVDIKGRLPLDDVVHKAAIDVNEEGTTAAGISRSSMLKSSDCEEFTLDHPFMFMIIENRSNMILFMGRVHNL